MNTEIRLAILALVVVIAALAFLALTAPPAEVAPGPTAGADPGPWERSAPPSDLYQRGRTEFAAQNFRRAAEAFAAFIAAQPRHPDVPRAVFDLAESRLRLQEFDAALDTLTEFLAGGPGRLWEARGRVEIAGLLSELPRGGWRYEDEVHYDQEQRQGEWVHMASENAERRVAELETARRLVLDLAGRPAAETGAAPGDDLVAELLAVELALADSIEAAGGELAEPAPPAAGIDPPLPDAAYEPTWPARKKVLFLLDETARLASEFERPESAADARFLKALFLARYPEAPPAEFLEAEAARRAAHEAAGIDPPRPEYIPAAYDPGPALDPLALTRANLAALPDSPKADLWLGFEGRLLEARGDYPGAVAVYRRFLERFPASPYAGEVRAALDALMRPALRFSAPGVVYPGRTAALEITARNLEAVQIAVYPIDLHRVLSAPESLHDPERDFASLANFGEDLAAIKRRWLTEPAASFGYDPADPGGHRATTGRAELALERPGAYLVLASGAEVEQLALIVFTDVVLLEHQGPGEVRYLVADAATGRPLAGFPLLVKEVYQVRRPSWRRAVRHRELASDGSGRAVYELAAEGDSSRGGVQALAHQGSRFAFGPEIYAAFARGAAEHAGLEVFTVTDRPVYRPGQTVRFEHVVRRRTAAGLENAPGLTCLVTVQDARGNRLLERKATTDEWGCVTGELELAEDAALGVYQAGISFPESGGIQVSQSGGAGFRVEEYKKPEFEVLVRPAADLARQGESVPVAIEAATYFGARVGGATVSYTVERQVHWPRPPRPRPFEWLYGVNRGGGIRPPFERHGGELVAEGQGRTDETGRFTFDLPPVAPGTPYDYRYTIHAEVTDLTRRTIEGTGSLFVTRQPFHVAIDPDRGFYAPGDRAEFEITAATAAGTPVEAEGLVIVEELTFPPAAEEQAEEIERSGFACDQQGRAVFAFRPARAGQYRVRVEAQGGTAAIEAEVRITVAAGEFPGLRFRFADLTLTAEKRIYRRGETLRLLAGTPFPEAHVWLVVQAGDQIFEDRLASLPQGSAVIELPIQPGFVPNVFARAMLVRDGEVHVQELEILVPPVEELLEVEVEPDPAELGPAATGRLQVRVRDWAGKPAAARLILSVFDSSVLYIQPETSGDIRAFYHGGQRHLGLRLAQSGEVSMPGLHEDRRPVPKSEGPNLPAPGGYGGRFGGDFAESEMAFRDGANMVGSLAAPPPMAAREMKAGAAPEEAAPEGAGGAEPAPARLREFFPDTALWLPALAVGPDGKATVEVAYPDSLTTWAVRATAVTAGPQVGRAEAEVVTTKKVVARLETPRFLVEGDRSVLAAVVHNGFEHDIRAELELTVEGAGLAIEGPARADLTVPAGGDARHDFSARATGAGAVRLTLAARSAEESDALARPLPILIYGAERLEARAAVLRQPGEAVLAFEVPEARRPEASRLTVVVEPTLAGTLVQAIPYLIDYPYGCVEQTLSRFVPAVLMRGALQDLGANLDELARLPAQGSLADPLSGELAGRPHPVYDEKTLRRVTREGLKRLSDFQHADGGWGWWAGGDSDPYMSAHVVHGLTLARRADLAVDETMLERGVAYLAGLWAEPERRDHREQPELRAYLAFVLSLHDRLQPGDLDGLYATRVDLTPYGKSLLALALQQAGDGARAGQVVENLADLAWDDPERGSATFKPPATGWWWWYQDQVETTAFALQAFLAVRPEHPLADRLARWLIENRQGNRWNSSKDTAVAVETLIGYMRQRGELAPDSRIEVAIGGRTVAETAVTAATALTARAVVTLAGDEIESGRLPVTVGLSGSGSAYASAYLETFSLETPIPAAASQIRVERAYYRLTPETAERESWGGGTITERAYAREKLAEGAPLASGDLLEVQLTIEAPNDYEYLVFEDAKPAGCEPVERTSGAEHQAGAYAHRELRDEQVVFFLDRLRQGTQVLTYRLRAEIPGTFQALPFTGYAMYAPRVRANSESREIEIEPEPAADPR